MLDIFDAYATDESKELNGVDVSIGGGAVLKIARANNHRFNSMLQESVETNQQALSTLAKEEAADLDRKLMNEAVARHVLLGWTGVSYKGKELKYNQKNAMMLLAHPDFKKVVLFHSNKMEHYKAEADAADEKK